MWLKAEDYAMESCCVKPLCSYLRLLGANRSADSRMSIEMAQWGYSTRQMESRFCWPKIRLLCRPSYSILEMHEWHSRPQPQMYRATSRLTPASSIAGTLNRIVLPSVLLTSFGVIIIALPMCLTNVYTWHDMIIHKCLGWDYVKHISDSFTIALSQREQSCLWSKSAWSE